tara:strand:- start:5118 stop:5594 length:477 start_codon:yes stop_codon:yes gene_type:complete
MTNKNKNINLTEINSSLNFREEIVELDLLEKLGKIQEGIKVNAIIKKVSKDLFLAEGSILVTFMSECQKCFRQTKIELDLKLNVGIKDKSLENFDKKGPLDIHYQYLERFDINKLITEEIHLNFPSFVYCCSSEEVEQNTYKKKEIQRPFKKIRDLIK